MTILRNYIPEPTLLKFHNDDSEVRGLVGPVGAGKSVGCTLELLSRSMRQRPFTDGVRRTRWGIIRNTGPELRSTTIKTVQAWLPDEIFSLKSTYPLTGTLSFALPDGTSVHSEWVFIALDQPEDVKKLKSFELTGVWINEASELSKDVVDMAMSRYPRYPSKDLQGGATWSGMIMDTNAPSEDSWWYDLFEVEKPVGHKIYHQPPAVQEILDPQANKMVWVGHPDAENITHLDLGYDYYLRQIPGKSRAWINVFLCAKYGESLVGRPVFAGEYVPSVHNSTEILTPDRTLPVILGWDWGLFPAVVFGQADRYGALKILYEVAPDTDVSLEAFIEDYVSPVVMQHFQGCTFVAYGDPAGRGRSAIDKRTPFSIVGQAGIRCVPTYTNDFLPRRDSLAGFMNRRDGLLISAQCKKLRKGLARDYYYAKLSGGSGEFKVRPEKNMSSHVVDACMYMTLGIRGMNRVTLIDKGGNSGQAW